MSGVDREFGQGLGRRRRHYSDSGRGTGSLEDRYGWWGADSSAR